MDVTLLDLVGEPIYHRPAGFGITVKECAREKHCSETAARALLDAAVEDDALGKHLMMDGRTRPMVYHRPGEWPPKS